jgi:hypothetical protein
MSYGKGSGEPYLSDLTLAFLNDTGHFLASNARAGSFATTDSKAAQCNEFGSTAFVDFVFGNNNRERPVSEGARPCRTCWAVTAMWVVDALIVVVMAVVVFIVVVAVGL